MAQQVRVSWLDDVDGSEAVETVSFWLDGRAYEIDLSEKNAAKLRKLMAKYASAGRQIGGAARAPRTAPDPRSAAADQRTRAVRAWALAQGFTVSARGRIPTEIVRAYDARQATPTPEPSPEPAPVAVAPEDPPRSGVSLPVFSGL